MLLRRKPSARRAVAVVAAIAAMAAGTAFGSTSAAAAGNDGYKMPSRSGSAWASGTFVLGYDTERYKAFGDYRERPLDLVSTFPPRLTWDDFIQPGPAYATFTGRPYTMVYGVPMIPEADGASLAECADGAYTQKWTTFAHTLTDAGLGSSVIRLGWEMNGDWFAWGRDGDAAGYRDCFRNVVTAVRAVAPGLKFDWNVNRGSSTGIPDTWELQNVAYPGDDYVDIIGVDTYDSWVDWNWALNDPEQGMNAWLAFAREHGKKLSFPEWGLYTTTYPSTGKPAPGHGDQPDYIQHMFDFFQENAADIAYEAYFNNEGDDGHNSLWNPVNMPLASAKYKALYRTAPPAGVTSIQDTARGSGVGQVEFSANWGQCTTTCGKVSDGSYVWTATPGSTATVRFSGSRLRWFGMREPFSVIATVAIDGGTPVDVDPYVPTAGASSEQLYVSPVLAEGVHTAVITMTDRRNPDSTGGSSITFDRVDVASGLTSIQDTARGSGVGQVQFSANWGQCTTTCGKVSDGSYVWTATPGSTATVRFSGSRLRWFGMREPFSVIATVAIDGGTPVDVDPYVPTAGTGSEQLYVSPVLAEGVHTAVITMTDRRNPDSTGGSSITFDHADVEPASAAAEGPADLQETPEDPTEVDTGNLFSAEQTAVDKAEIGATVVTMCEPGAGKWSWAGRSNPWTVTHAKGYENFTGSSATYTKSATKERTITATASVTAGATIEANVIIGKLDATVSYTLAVSGTATNTSSESVTATMKPGYVYIYYAGARRTTGQYTYSVCNSRGTAVTVRSRGKAVSFGLKREGAVRCGSSVAGGSLGYVAERDYC